MRPFDRLDRVVETCLLGLIIVPPFLFGAVPLWAQSALEVTALVAAGVWLLKNLRRSKFRYFRSPLHLPLFLFLLLILFQSFPMPNSLLRTLSPMTHELYSQPSVVAATYGGSPPPTLVPVERSGSSLSPQLRPLTLSAPSTRLALYRILAYLLIFIVVTQWVRDSRQVKRLVFAVVAGGGALASFGLLQAFTWNEKIYWVREVPLGAVPFGPYVNQNHYSGYLVMAIALTLGALVAERGRGMPWRKSPFWLTCLVLLMGAALVMSGSFGGVLSLAAALLGFGLCLQRGWSLKRWLTLGIILALAAPFLWGTVFPASFPFGGEEFRGRVWQATHTMIGQFPTWGTGLGSFNEVFPAYRTSNIGLTFEHAHNDYLELLAEGGAIGFLLVAAFWIILLGSSMRSLRYLPGGWRRGMIAGGSAACIGILVFSLFDFNMQIPANALLLTIIVGLIHATSSMAPRKNRRDRMRRERGYRLGKTSRWVLSTLVVLGALGMIFSVVRTYGAEWSFQRWQGSRLPRLNTAIGLSPANPRYRYERAVYFERRALEAGASIFERRVWLNKAHAELQEVVGRAPTQGRYFFHLGWIEGSLGRPEAAAEAIRIALDLDPRNPFLFHSVGLFHRRAGDETQAKAAFLQAHEFMPELLPGTLELYWEETQQYEDLRQTVPDIAEAHFQFGQFLDRQGKEEAEIEFQKALELDPDKDTFQMRAAQFSFRQREYARAQDLSEAIGRGSPYYAGARVLLGRIAFAQGDDLTAQSRLLEAAQVEPTNFEVYLNLGKVYFRQGDREAAISSYERALSLKLDLAEAYADLGQIYVQGGEEDQAIQAYQQALQHNPESWEFHLRLARIYLGRQEHVEGIDRLKAAIDLNPAVSVLHRQLGQAYEAVGRSEEAIAAYERALELEPGSRWLKEQLSRLRAGRRRRNNGGRCETVFSSNVSLAVAGSSEAARPNLSRLRDAT